MKTLIKKLCLIFIVLLSVFGLFSCTFYDDAEKIGPETFDDFAQSLFVSLIGQDELTCNFYFENRENFGLENYEPSLYIPTESSILGIALINLYYGRIKLYDYNQLNDAQKMTYNIIVDLLDYINGKVGDMCYLDNNYLGSYLGYQAQLPILLAEYHFRCELDIINYLKYLSLVPETFIGYYEFEITKADSGYGMPDFVIDKVISQCDNFSSSIIDGSCFLISVTNNKIDECDFLSSEQKEYYKNSNLEKINTSLFEGYNYIKNNLGNLKGRATNNQGLAHYGTIEYPIGKLYYELIFKRAVGYDISADEAISYIDSKITLYETELASLKEEIRTNAEYVSILASIQDDSYQLMTGTPLEQLELYKELIKDDFPSLSVDPVIDVKFVDDAMKDNFSPAAYMTSAIDNTGSESIYLNPSDVFLYDNEGNIISYDGNYLYNTLAHEGLPGHLYQNVYFKSKDDVSSIRKVLTCSGYTEGWATYVENYSYNYLRGTLPDVIVDYLILSSKFEAALYSRLDLGIHYDGWSVEELYDFMKPYFKVSSVDDCVKAYQQLVEIPTNYQKYFFTYLKFCDMYDAALEASGSNFDVKEFHTLILDLGSVPLKYVEEAVYEAYNISK